MEACTTTASGAASRAAWISRTCATAFTAMSASGSFWPPMWLVCAARLKMTEAPSHSVAQVDLADVAAHQFHRRIGQVRRVGAAAEQEAVERHDARAALRQRVAEIGAEKTGPAGDQNPPTVPAHAHSFLSAPAWQPYVAKLCAAVRLNRAAAAARRRRCA